MFRKSTVFILGAGANSEFGLPLGSQLMTTVGDDLGFKFEGGIRLVSGNDELLRLFKNKFGESHREYTKAARELIQVMTRFPSLDEALHYLSANEKCVTAAKTAIVSVILGAEKESTLRFEGRLGRPDLTKTTTTWGAQFLSMALSNFTQGDVSTIFDNVTIINFNYDRALSTTFIGRCRGMLSFQGAKRAT